MNQLYRALHIPPKRLLRKISGEKEIYTIAVRPVPKAEGTDPLPALGGTPYTMLPARPGFWYADPLLYHRDGRRWLYAEAMDHRSRPHRGLRAARRRRGRGVAGRPAGGLPPLLPHSV